MQTRLILALLVVIPLLGGCIAAAVVGAGAAGAMMATDRRSTGAYTDDETLEWKISLAIRDKFGEKAVHINVTSFNRIVLLTGEAPSEEVRQEIQKIAQAQKTARDVRNEIVVGQPTALQSWTDDSYITSKVMANMVGNPDVNQYYVKVVTENSVVYLMGLVTRKEGEAAAEVAANTSGVKRVVKVFEYTG
ncbi:MAG: BON domain-containing protein [Burkholderiales bacterium]